MKKIVLTSFMLIVVVLASLYSQDISANDAYVKAVTTKDPAQKYRLLKDFIAKYAGKGIQNENYAYAQLCLLPYSGKTASESIQYGEKALALGGLDDIINYQILVAVSGIYCQLGQNLEKANKYAMKAIQIAKDNKNKNLGSSNTVQWNQLIGAGYFVHGQILEKTEDLEGAVNSYISSYNILKNKQIAVSLRKTGKFLYDRKSYSNAEKAFKISYEALNDFASCTYYAKSLHRCGKKDLALKYYKEAYTKQKNGELAYNIGIILAEKVKSNSSVADEAIRYLLEASFLSASHSEKAMKLAEGIYFNKNKEYNEKVKQISEKNKKIEELTNSFNKRFGDKDEEDLSDDEKKEMESMLKQIESEHKAIEKLEVEQKVILDKFNSIIEQTKQRLGI